MFQGYHSVRFRNQGILKSIVANDVMERHQIDLVDMHPNEVKSDGDVYRYILTVQDVFSR